MKRQVTIQLVSILLLIFVSAGAWAVSSQQMGTVINLAGKQRMLTQKMSKEVLLIAAGVEVDANKANLKKTADLFDRTLKGLINGDAGLGLPKTTDPAIQAQLEKVSALWAEFRKSVDAVLAGNTDKAVLQAIASQNLPLLKNMNQAVQMYTKMSGSKLDPAMATTINLAGKQRMLTQKMTKELLLIANGIDADANKANLKKTVALFERTLKGLMNGDGELGLPGTKDPAIRAQLEVVQKLWAEYKPVLDAVDTSPAGLQKAAKLNLPLLKEMNKAVKMYEKSVK
jgi:nitrate/nitrite-specific signal transduction histidine kinase